jgi:hypothetical protein
MVTKYINPKNDDMEKRMCKDWCVLIRTILYLLIETFEWLTFETTCQPWIPCKLQLPSLI